jgi:SAM-dependent methyltransferase
MNTSLQPDVFDRLSALADPTRSRLLVALEGHELTVTELCAVLQLPQSTISRHLKILADDGWIASRAEGTSRLYSIESRLDPHANELWQLVRSQFGIGITAKQDALRLRAVISDRRAKSQEFFSTASARWDALRAELFGDRPDRFAMPGLLDPGWVVADLGCGTGQVAESLAPWVAHVIAVDSSAPMLDAARARLGGTANVDLRQGELETLPIDDGSVDAAVMSLVLHHVPEPDQVLREVRRTLRDAGRLLIVDMLPHEREEYRQQMGHVWQGFSETQLAAWLDTAGLTLQRFNPLPVDPDAKGPALFAASATR